MIDASDATAGITFNLIAGRVGPTDAAGDTVAITGSGQNDVFIIAGSIIGLTPALDMNGLVQGGGGDQDEVRLGASATVGRLNFDSFAGGNLSLRGVEVITLNGGNATIALDASLAPAGITFNLISGSIGSVGGFTGSGFNDLFIVSGDITSGSPALDINSLLEAGDGQDEVRLIANAVVDNLNFGTFTAGELNLAAVETITIEGGTVNTAIDASDAPINASPPASGVSAGVTGVTFNLVSGVAGSGDITGSGFNDLFLIAGDITGSQPGTC